jgi:hypothetical protein
MAFITASAARREVSHLVARRFEVALVSPEVPGRTARGVGFPGLAVAGALTLLAARSLSLASRRAWDPQALALPLCPAAGACAPARAVAGLLL